MRINYFSDIHLEFGSCAVPDTNADIVIAAGDIGVYDQGIAWLKAIDKPVIYVAGNHEYYNFEYHDTLQMLRERSANTNIYFLENNSLKFKDVRFLGCSLWSDLFINGPELAAVFAWGLNDFRKIRYADELFSPERYTDLFHHSIAWLERELAKPFDGKTVVITHHAPTLLSWYDSADSIKILAYCNNLQSLLQKYDIDVWFHGHTHSIGNYRVAGTRILSNTRGYHGRREVARFDLNKTVAI